VIISLESDQHTDYIKVFVVFDTNTGLEYKLIAHTGHKNFGPHVNLCVTNSTPTPYLSEDGGGIEYYDEGALSFWTQLRGFVTVDDRSQYDGLQAIITAGYKEALTCLELAEQAIKDKAAAGLTTKCAHCEKMFLLKHADECPHCGAPLVPF
jgi:hypothetical protein